MQNAELKQYFDITEYEFEHFKAKHNFFSAVYTHFKSTLQKREIKVSPNTMHNYYFSEYHVQASLVVGQSTRDIISQSP
jgi:hypothetical protein